MTKAEANAITGGLSWPSAMPCPAYSLPATACKTGSKLRKIEGTSCSKCYALKGRYMFPNVKTTLERRLLSLTHPQWVEAMIFLIEPHHWFRWHDSGDLQSKWHFRRICKVAKQTTNTEHWLPTTEMRFVHNPVPSNLVIRYSLPKINQRRPSYFPVPTSGVVTEKATCRKRDGKCESCRWCWDRSIEHITYRQH